MATLTKKQKKAVQSIIVSYPAWYEYRQAALVNIANLDNLRAMKLWAKILDEDQKALGVETVNSELLEANIAGFVYSYLDRQNVLRYTNDIEIALKE